MSVTVLAAVVTVALFAWLGPDRIGNASIFLCLVSGIIGTLAFVGTKRAAEGQSDAPNMVWALPDIAVRTALGCFAIMFPMVWEWYGEAGYGIVLVVAAVVAGLAWFAGMPRMEKHADGLRLVFMPVVLVQLAAYAAYHVQFASQRIDGAKPVLWAVAIILVAWALGSLIRRSVAEDAEGPAGADVKV